VDFLFFVLLIGLVDVVCSKVRASVYLETTGPFGKPGPLELRNCHSYGF